MPTEQTQTSRLINDLTKVPHIVGALGLSIAAAQKAFNLDYMDNIERLLFMTKALLGRKKTDGSNIDEGSEEDKKIAEFEALFKDLLSSLAPPRYQYTETTLAVKLDLAQTMDMGVSIGLGVGFQGIAINAAFTIGYGYDYRAAAECRTVIHAIPADKTVFDPLMNRAATVNDKVLALPERSEVDQKIIDQAYKIFEKLIGFEPPNKETPN
ncbi:hypothetical protein ACFL9T_05215 [Thermodesulfobacteriota bacterium]